MSSANTMPSDDPNMGPGLCIMSAKPDNDNDDENISPINLTPDSINTHSQGMHTGIGMPSIDMSANNNALGTQRLSVSNTSSPSSAMLHQPPSVKSEDPYDVFNQYQLSQAGDLGGLVLNHSAAAAVAAAVAANVNPSNMHHSMSQHPQEIYLDQNAKLRLNAGSMYNHSMHHHGHYLSQEAVMAFPMGGPTSSPADARNYLGDGLTPQKAVAFLAGPRERIHVFGNPLEFCPRCHQEGYGNVNWRPHRHIGELKIRYICERNFDDLESNHHFDIPLCPLCGQVLYLYEFNGMLGVSSARRLHKYVLKCANRHVLPLIDLFCQTKRGGDRCNSNFKLQWSYGTMVKRCESQKNRDHDLWWVRYKNEWKQRRTIIRYKKDFLRHLSDVQRALLLGLGIEGESPPDPKAALGPTYDALVATAGGSPSGPKIKKRQTERGSGMGHMGQMSHDDYDYDMGSSAKRQHRQDVDSSGGVGGNGLVNAFGTCSSVTEAYHQMLRLTHGSNPSAGGLAGNPLSMVGDFTKHYSAMHDTSHSAVMATGNNTGASMPD